MVKVLVTVPATVTQLPGKKLLAGAVYKRQRKLPNSTSQSSHPGLPDRKPSNPPFNCGQSVSARLCTIPQRVRFTCLMVVLCSFSQSGSKPEIRPPVLHVETDRQTKSLQRPRAIQKPPKGKTGCNVQLVDIFSYAPVALKHRSLLVCTLRNMHHHLMLDA